MASEAALPRVARAAGLLGDLPAVRFDLNIVLIAADGEEKRMPEAVGCFRCILAQKVRRRMAAVTGCGRPVGGLEPAVELLAHDVAVGAGRRIVSEVGPTLGIREGIDANPDGNAENDAKQDTLNRARCHRGFRSPTSALRAAQRHRE